MDVVLKTLLYSYPSFNIVIDGLEKLAEYKAISSFSCSSKTVKQMENIIRINEQIAKMDELKAIMECLLSKLSLKEKMLLEYKYFKHEMPDGFDCSSRQYFREQNKLMKKLIKSMENKGYNVEWFEGNYLNIFFLKVKYKKLKKLKQQGSVNNSNRERWI